MTLQKLQKGDKVAVLSPSFAAPGMFPPVFGLGLERLRTIFELEPVEYPSTRKLGASVHERADGLVKAFTDPDIRAVIASIGGDDQVTYIKNLSPEPFKQNPKPFFGFSDNSHFCNFLFLHGIPSYYGGSIMTQYAMQGAMDDYSIQYLKHALFNEGELELTASDMYNDQGYDWSDSSLLHVKKKYWNNKGFVWDGKNSAEGILWGGCLESIYEMLRHNTPLPSHKQFENIILMLETSEEIPTANYVFRVVRALGERGVLERVNGVLVGRAKAWEFDKRLTLEQKEDYKKKQKDTIITTIRKYNIEIPIILHMDFGHTDPQIPMPYGNNVRIDMTHKKIFAHF